MYPVGSGRRPRPERLRVRRGRAPAPWWRSRRRSPASRARPARSRRRPRRSRRPVRSRRQVGGLGDQLRVRSPAPQRVGGRGSAPPRTARRTSARSDRRCGPRRPGGCPRRSRSALIAAAGVQPGRGRRDHLGASGRRRCRPPTRRARRSRRSGRRRRSCRSTCPSISFGTGSRPSVGQHAGAGGEPRRDDQRRAGTTSPAGRRTPVSRSSSPPGRDHARSRRRCRGRRAARAPRRWARARCAGTG